MVVGMSEIPAKGVQNPKAISRQAIVVKAPVQVAVPSNVNANNAAFDRQFGKVATCHVHYVTKSENGTLLRI